MLYIYIYRFWFFSTYFTQHEYIHTSLVTHRSKLWLKFSVPPRLVYNDNICLCTIHILNSYLSRCHVKRRIVVFCARSIRLSVITALRTLRRIFRMWQNATVGFPNGFGNNRSRRQATAALSSRFAVSPPERVILSSVDRYLFTNVVSPRPENDSRSDIIVGFYDDSLRPISGINAERTFKYRRRFAIEPWSKRRVRYDTQQCRSLGGINGL